ncbi:MAG: lactate utilization protein [Firmicutes bacterium]|nr:lactate utilization protein [Bacillota bacterium]
MSSHGVPSRKVPQDQEAFLAHLRSRLTSVEKAPHPGRWRGRDYDDPPAAPPGVEPAAGETDRLIDRFSRELSAVGGKATLVSNPEDLKIFLQALTGSRNVRTAVRDSHPWWFDPSCSLDARLPERHARTGWLQALEDCGLEVVAADASRDTVAAADIGITWADWGIAETGSLVLLSGEGRSRVASLLPPVHVALLPAHRIAATRAQVFARLREHFPPPAWPANAVLVTGPSRTADIENDLSIGVHGPAEVHVLIVSPPGVAEND